MSEQKKRFKVKALRRGFSGKQREKGEVFIYEGEVHGKDKFGKVVPSAWLEVLEDLTGKKPKAE